MRVLSRSATSVPLRVWTPCCDANFLKKIEGASVTCHLPQQQGTNRLAACSLKRWSSRSQLLLPLRTAWRPLRADFNTSSTPELLFTTQPNTMLKVQDVSISPKPSLRVVHYGVGHTRVNTKPHKKTRHQVSFHCFSLREEKKVLDNTISFSVRNVQSWVWIAKETSFFFCEGWLMLCTSVFCTILVLKNQYYQTCFLKM